MATPKPALVVKKLNRPNGIMPRLLSVVVGSSLILFMVLPAITSSATPPEPDIEQLRKNFKTPPPGYGMVPFHWWQGEPLDMDRLTWQLDKLKEFGCAGVQVNHTPYSSREQKATPTPMSDEWWEFWNKSLKEFKKRDMKVGMDDWGFKGDNWDLGNNPDIRGFHLGVLRAEGTNGQKRTINIPGGYTPLTAQAYLVKDGKLDPDSAVDVYDEIDGKVLEWTAPEGPDKFKVLVVCSKGGTVDMSNPRSGEVWINNWFEPVNQHSQGYMGDAVSYFFNDDFWDPGFPFWSKRLEEEFPKRKGYDLVEALPALFEDLGPRSYKIRLDYYDVAVSLLEDGWFKPLYEWTEKHNIIYGHDNLRGSYRWGVKAYGDYFRAQRWFSAPGSDRTPDLHIAKTVASIAQLYDRERSWLEAYYGEGWDFDTKRLYKYNNQALVRGFNMFSYHSLYYTTRAGWWEHAPGDPHFRQPYWDFTLPQGKYVERMSWLLSQGKHRCDVALMDPTATIQIDPPFPSAGEGPLGSIAEETVYAVMNSIYEAGIDFDVIDAQSMARATVKDGRLAVSGGEYKVVILPAMSAVHYETMEKLHEFYRGGGMVAAVECLPSVSDRVGAEDEKLDAMVQEVFGETGKSPDVVIEHSVRDKTGFSLKPYWIWNPGDRIANSRNYFVKSFDIPAEVAEAQITITAASNYLLHVNGKEVGKGTYWLAVQQYDLAEFLQQGTNTITISSSHYSAGGGGVLAESPIKLKNGQEVVVRTDDSWVCSGEKVDQWPDVKDTDDSHWHAVKLSAPIGSGEWSLKMKLGKPAAKATKPTINCNSAGGLGSLVGSSNDSSLIKLISDNIERDFVSDSVPFNVLHRRIDETDLYVVMNPTEATVKTDAHFLCKGAPMLWDGWTGTEKPILEYETTENGTRIPLTLSAQELRLIVFDNKAPAAPMVVNTNLDEVKQITTGSKGMVVTGYAGSKGKKLATVVVDGEKIVLEGQCSALSSARAVEGLWETEIIPTMDNIWGDFRSPASDEKIGAAAYRFQYMDEPAATAANGPHEVKMDDSKWQRVTFSYGPLFYAIGPIPKGTDTSPIEETLLKAKHIDPKSAITVDGKDYNWTPISTSLRWGLENDSTLRLGGNYGGVDGNPWGHKSNVPDALMDLTSNKFNPQWGQSGALWYVWSTLKTSQDTDTRLAVGSPASFKVWVNGRDALQQPEETPNRRIFSISAKTAPISLKKGINPMVLRLAEPNKTGRQLQTRAYVAVDNDLRDETYEDTKVDHNSSGLLARRWYTRSSGVSFDSLGQQANRIGWYRFPTPPGTKEMQIVAHGKIQVWVDGKPLKVETVTESPSVAKEHEGATVYRAVSQNPIAQSSIAEIRMELTEGYYGGAALPEPVDFKCVKGEVALKQWHDLGMENYSGQVGYSKTINLTSEQCGGKVTLDLGKILYAARVFVNDKEAGTLIAPPYVFDITEFVKPGDNKLKVVVANTLGNYYMSFGYFNAYVNEDNTKSGLLGPVNLKFTPKVKLSPIGALDQVFLNPKDVAKPWVYWFWNNGNYSKEGITADLEAMKKVGIQGGIICITELLAPKGPVRFGTPAWMEMVTHSFREAGRLGMNLDMVDCEGWGTAGGPWITPDKSQKKLVWTTAEVSGGKGSVGLEQPHTLLDYYQDVAVLAYPQRPYGRINGKENLKKVEADWTPEEGDHQGGIAAVFDDDPNTALRVVAKKDTQHLITTELKEPATARAITIRWLGWTMPTTLTLEVSDDGKTYRTLVDEKPQHDFNVVQVMMPVNSRTFTFPPVKARYWRIGLSCGFGFTEIAEAELTSAPRINNMEIKAAFTQTHGWGQSEEVTASITLPTPMESPPPADAMVPVTAVRNLSSQMDAAGMLTYDLPDGRWEILRFGYTATGEPIVPATEEGRGLECDKLDPDAIIFQLENLVGKIATEVSPLIGTGYQGVWMDSWEAHGQNWTGRLPAEFKERRGYDLIPYLPLIAHGQIIDSIDVSERVLWDFRRTLADMIRENFYGTAHRWINRKGLRYNGEFAGMACYLYDPMNYMMEVDTPVGEFWSLASPGGEDVRVAASIAHTSGRQTVGAEAYTDWGGFNKTPYKLKRLGDKAFCSGVNRYYFHSSSHQPWLDPKPGMTFGPWGIDFHRGNTWWEPGRQWVSYISRCSQMLHEGRFVADICNYIGDDVPNFVGRREAIWKPIPHGYDYDTVNTEILKQFKVKDGRLVLDSGMSYRVLLLPNRQAMLPESLKILQSLVKKGAVIAGPPPLRSPSLTKYPKADRQVVKIAEKLWGSNALAARQANVNATVKTNREVGKGRVTWGLSWTEIFDTLGEPEDFTSVTSDPNGRIDWIHRRTDDTDIYFLANPEYNAVDTLCSFRVTDRQPEFWDPDTGARTKIGVYAQADGRTRIPIHFDPAGSLFVIFRGEPAEQRVVSISRNQEKLFGSNSQTPAPLPEITFNDSNNLVIKSDTPGKFRLKLANGEQRVAGFEKAAGKLQVNGPWQVAFQKDRGAPEQITLENLVDLSQHEDEGVKYFSGTASYRARLEVPSYLIEANQVIELDLGDVQIIAEVELNGKPLGIVWKSPFKLDITDVVKPGRNELVVKVTNLWVNRLIGDEQYPDDCDWKLYGTNVSMLETWPDWFVNNEPRPTERMTFFPYKHHMKDSKLVKSGLVGPVTVTLSPTIELPEKESLDQLFLDPEDEAKPWVYWYWNNGNYSKAGLTADLEAMKRVGIGGCTVAITAMMAPKGPIEFGTPEWMDTVMHAIREAGRLDIPLSIMNCEGWGVAGGPWIKPETGQKKLVWTSTQVTGPQKIDQVIEQPETLLDFYRDVVVLAYPAVPLGRINAAADLANLTANWTPKDLETQDGISALVDGDVDTHLILTGDDPKAMRRITMELKNPNSARAITIRWIGWTPPSTLKLEASMDGQNYTMLVDEKPTADYAVAQVMMAVNSRTFSFPVTEGRFWRLTLSCGFGSTDLVDAELTAAPRIHDMQIKAAFVQTHNWGQTEEVTHRLTDRSPMESVLPKVSVVPVKKVRNISKHMDHAGRLTWKAPKGDWTVVRLGYTATAEPIHPATDSGRGLECDKFDPDVLNFQFEQLVAKLADQAGPLAGTAYHGVWIDSWEAHGQNWTEKFPQEFEKRRGYDMIPFLPVLTTGQIIETPEISERLLWDFRRTIADLVRENFFGAARRWLNSRGLQLTGEFAGQAGHLYDPINYMMEADVPVGEFWSLRSSGGGQDIRVAASIAHTSGRPTVGAEAFTNWGGYNHYPYQLKPLGDEAFCAGVNRYIFHTYSHQPWADPKPGMSFGPWGIDFHRGNTWWEPSRQWVTYLSRCQQLLREGTFVADICYYIGDDAPNFVGKRDTVWKKIPADRDFDCVNTEILRTFKVVDGRLVLPSGMSYRALLLPNRKGMVPGSLKIVQSLVHDGAIVVGPPPVHSPSLSDYPRADKQVKKIAADLWGAKGVNARLRDAKVLPKLRRQVREGWVYHGYSWKEIFDLLEHPEDFSAITDPEVTLNWIHRRTDDTDIYFIANREYKSLETICEFRVDGRAPELWNPDTGKQCKAAVYTQANSITKMPIHFDPAGSVFVIFRNNPDGRQFVAVTRNGQTLFDSNQKAAVSMPTLGYDKDGEVVFEQGSPGVYTFTQADGTIKTVTVENTGETMTVSGPWQLSFQSDRGAPAAATLNTLKNLSDHSDQGIKYFSGTVAYSSSFDLTAEAVKPDKRITIDLGDIAVIAEVIVNDKNMGITWKKPYQLDITEVVKPGKNQLTVKVANLWVNRLVGDEQYSDDCVWKPYSANFSMDKWPDWHLNNQPRPTERITFFPYKHHSKGKALPESGLLGPVKVSVTPQLIIKDG